CIRACGGPVVMANDGGCVVGHCGAGARVRDCNGDRGGTAVIDNCGECVGGNTGAVACVQDCNGDWGGTAVIDNCGECVGGNTGAVACVQDCNGDWGGTAVIDNCGECVGGNTGQTPCAQDCNGDFGGTAVMDNCGTCVGGNTGAVACVQDCEGTWGGTAMPGSACDDNNASTIDDTYNANCECVGTVSYDCPTLQANIGDACDDGDNGTVDDMVDSNCECHGTPVGPVCPGDEVVVRIITDGNPEEISWEITNAVGVTIATGSPSLPNAVEDKTVCLNGSPTSAWYGFRLMDSFGDGIEGGGWELRTTDGKLILRDDFDNGPSSPMAAPLSGGYGAYHSFALPLGVGRIHPGSCGRFDYRAYNQVFAVKVPGTNFENDVLNYQFEFSDPDSGYIRRIKKPRNYVTLSDLNPSPLWGGKRYFARVRTDKSGPITEAHWGTGCEMGLTTTVTCTQLIEAPSYGHSCGEVRRYGPSSFIYAQPVFGATQYEFRIFSLGEEYDETYVRNTYILELFGFANPLGQQSYQVQVRARVNNVWGNYCNTCWIHINNAPTGPAQSLIEVRGEATLWPNPVRDGQVYLNIDGIQSATQQITVDIKDIYGQQVYGQAFGNSGERFSTVLDLPADIASGVYLVNITVNGEMITKRLSVVR
ncbi:MAG: T9SS type A sorting domain-containing protein, partial [Flavobacteriales bacterium]|nr:T9SS type A sorting domain-containing protein [Flavobacteriales bacterium]